MGYFRERVYYLVKRINEQKKMFILLIVLQLLVFIGAGGYALFTSTSILAQLQQVVEALGTSIPPESASGMPLGAIDAGNLLTQNPQLILLQYHQLQSQFIHFLLTSSILFLVLQGMVWIASHHFVRKTSWQEKGKQAISYFISGAIFLAGLALAAYFLLGKPFLSQGTVWKWPFVLFLIAWYYSFLIYWLLLPHLWNGKIYGATLRRFSVFLPVLLLASISLAITLGAALFLMSLPSTFVWGTLFGLLFIILLVISRLYLLICEEGLHAPHH